jgi:hypothetical protein
MIEVTLNYKPLVAGILKAPAALPQHSAERLCLSGTFPYFSYEAPPQVRGIASNQFQVTQR